MSKFVDVYQISANDHSLKVFKDVVTGEYGWFYETPFNLYDRYNQTYEKAMQKIESFKARFCK